MKTFTAQCRQLLFITWKVVFRAVNIANHPAARNLRLRVIPPNLAILIMCAGFLSTNQMAFAQDQDAMAIDENGNVGITGRIKDKSGFVMPVGSILPYGGKKAPVGWVLCDGNSYSKTGKYADLYQVISTIYGGDDKKFNVPDLKKRFVAGASTEEYELGATHGSDSVSLDVTHMPSHEHTGKTGMDGSHSHTEQTTSRADNDDNDKPGNFIGDPNRNYYRTTVGVVTSTGSEHTHEFTTDPKGDAKPHENRPPFVALNYIIKY